MIFDLMKHHFDFKAYAGIDYTLPKDVLESEMKYHNLCKEMVKDLDSAIKVFQVKFSASYARLRIERHASGHSAREQMENILPEEVRQKEGMSGMFLSKLQVDMPKTLRINLLRTTHNEIAEKFKSMGYHIALKNLKQLEEEDM